ncbi:uncharacterized protein LOC129590105 isoform X2 [Paramacrobiotus metropolitanus]|uniref:uncharacterized protein LOC129590105 isoform X2 n=1 Tax=Paramacrobiotus metropolitanus TaxID=2943436 RepID=UPI0024461DA3|nr:uncharacterized protein LOC129590105 isoform X2 [Paramacrobiotus metropolitanus]
MKRACTGESVECQEEPGVPFRHSSLHILYVADEQISKFSATIFNLFLKYFKTSWLFNHVRWTNLAVPPVLPRKKPLMELPTAVLLIINNIGDLDNKRLLVMRKLLLQIHSKCPFLILLNLPRVQRLLPQRLFKGQRLQIEQMHKEFFMDFLPANVKDLLNVRVWACPKCTGKKVVKKCIEWLKMYNHPLAPLPPLPFGPAPAKPVRSVTIPRAVPKRRAQEFEDLPQYSPVKRIMRLTQSLSDTKLTAMLAKNPQHRPEEPRYDAEYEDFRSRREMRRFVRRLREALRLRQLDAARSPTDVADSAYHIEITSVSGLTSVTNVDARSEDYDGDEEDTDEETSGLTGYTIINGHVSAIGQPPSEVEPVVLRMGAEPTNMVAAAVHAERIRPPLPVDSFETMFHSPTFMARPAQHNDDTVRLISARTTTDDN